MGWDGVTGIRRYDGMMGYGRDDGTHEEAHMMGFFIKGGDMCW